MKETIGVKKNRQKCNVKTCSKSTIYNEMSRAISNPAPLLMLAVMNCTRNRSTCTFAYILGQGYRCRQHGRPGTEISKFLNLEEYNKQSLLSRYGQLEPGHNIGQGLNLTGNKAEV